MSATLISKIFAGVELLNPGGQCFTCFNSINSKMILSLNVGTELMVLQGTLIVETIDVMTLVVDTLQIGNPPVVIPSALLQMYNNDSSTDAQFVSEQGGSGDVAMRLFLTGSQSYIFGIDNSANNDPFKLASGTALGTNDVLYIDYVDCNIGIGLNALGSIIIGATNNVAYGNSALETITTADNNTAVGCEALRANTADSNTAVGFQALTANTIGIENTAVGHMALSSQVSFSNNTAVGYNALLLSTASDNTAVGANALTNNTSGSENTAIGLNSLNSNTLGMENTAVGHSSLFSNISGDFNTAVGRSALTANTTGDNNIAVGDSALSVNTSGTQNIAVGSGTLGSNMIGADNTAVGYNALAANTTSINTAVGSGALQLNTSGNNTAVGSSALTANTTGNQNTAVGTSALTTNVTTNDNTAVGHLALRLNIADENTAVGSNALTLNSTGAGNTAMGVLALALNVSGDDNTAIGRSALSSATSSESTAVGARALSVNTSGNKNTAVGVDALAVNTFGDSNTAVGDRTLVLQTTGNSNTAIGRSALAATTTTSQATAVGRSALTASTATGNTAVGYQSLVANTTATAQTAVGWNALASVVTLNNNTAVGHNAATLETSGNNAIFGAFALESNTGGGGTNTIIGADAMQNVTTGSNNIALGFSAGSVPTGSESDNIFIGNVGAASDNNLIKIGNNTDHTMGTFFPSDIGLHARANRYYLEETFNQRPQLNASVAFTTNLDFEIIGTSATDINVIFAANFGGISLDTTIAAGDQNVVQPHLDPILSSWTGVNWDTAQSLEWECALQPVHDTDVIYWAGLKLTFDQAPLTDAFQAYFRSVDGGNWFTEVAIAGANTSTDTGIAATAGGTFRFAILIDSSRVARMYINEVLVTTTGALDSTNLIPYVGVETSTAAARTVNLAYEKISRIL